MHILNRLFNKAPRFGLLTKPKDRENAVKQILKGEPLVMQLGGVYGLFADASNNESIERIFTIKGKRKESLTVIKCTESIIQHADFDAISEELGKNLAEIGSNLGLVAHLRFPIKESYANSIPQITYSYYNDATQNNTYPVLQYLDPSSHRPMLDFINLLEKNGIKHIVATSFNDHLAGEPEITNKKRAITLAKEKKLPLIMIDPLHVRTGVKGSYAIVLCILDKISLIRRGAVDPQILNAILNNRLSITEHDNQQHPSHNYEEFVILLKQRNLTGAKAKKAFLLYMQGRDINELYSYNF